VASSPDDDAALTNLAGLLRLDLSTVDADKLILGAPQAEAIRKAAPEWSGRLLAELNRRGHSWPEISRPTGISQTTAYRRAQPYLPGDDCLTSHDGDSTVPRGSKSRYR
jgi:hypothetical protein